MSTVADKQPAAKRSKPARAKTPDRGPAPTLQEVQDSFQRCVIDGDDAILALIPDNSRTDHKVLLGVYRHAYAGRLVDVAAHDYPVLKAYFGDEAFDTMARAYIRAHPSHTPNARWFSHALPEFLDETEPYRSHAETGELAHLERALGDAFDAADGPVATIESLRTVPPEQWDKLVFKPHSSAMRLDNETNAFAIWMALKAEAEPPPARLLAERETLLVWRQDVMPKVRVLGPEETMMWNEASKGVPFGVLCELAATYDDPDGAALRAAQYLQGWLVSGCLSSAVVMRSKPTRKRAS